MLVLMWFLVDFCQVTSAGFFPDKLHFMSGKKLVGSIRNKSSFGTYILSASTVVVK